MKATLEFDLPEDKDDLLLALNATKYTIALDEIGNQVFRPARKHGYSNPLVQTLIDKLNDLVETLPTEVLQEKGWPVSEYQQPLNAIDLIALLEKMYYDILQDNTIEG